MSRSLLSAVTGNTPCVRGAVVDRLLKLSPRAVVLAVSIQAQGEGYPTVQRFLSGSGTALAGTALPGATGDPVVILRQDLLSLRRSADASHVVLAVPGDVDVLSLMVELWRPRVSSGSLGDHYDAAPLVVAVDTEAFLADIGCVHRTQLLWSGGDRGESVTRAEAAARQVEAADILVVPRPAGRAFEPGDVELIGQLNYSSLLLTSAGTDGAEGELPASLVRRLPPGADEGWRSRLEPVGPPRARRGGSGEVRTLCWRARRPLHPERLAEALAVVMSGVVRGRGHLWLCSRPDVVVAWRSAGAYLELREADRWLDEDPRCWAAASPQRRMLASWYWHDYYGERRSEITLTGVGLDQEAVRSALDKALLTDQELSLGPLGWTSIPDPLLGDIDRG
ncbi:GTP-binding protein [Streptomyces sp. NPDC028635]|uniref:GTP-binding protein n=1 Tax=Streptomyces sp. NPDC028635 TaxID=3154800 RepID=UPI0033D74318